MKSFVRLVVIAIAMLPLISVAQTSKSPSWPELKKFHSYMSSTFHPAEEGNFTPLKLKADSMLFVAKAWQASEIPANYKPEETKETINKLVEQCKLILAAVETKADDAKLNTLITEGHDIFHKIVGECRKHD